MTSKDVIKEVIAFCHMVTRTYIDDLTDQQLLTRSVPDSNHIAWQLGHCVTGEAHMLAQLGHAPPALPPGFAEAYTKETASSDEPARFHSKDVYLGLMDKCKTATLAAIDATPDTDLDNPAPEAMREYAPTMTAALLVLGTHWLMHAGQFVPVRRKLGIPALF